MKIGIIGAGKVGGGLGKLWVRAGHQVLFSSRHPKRLRVLVEEAGPGAYLGDVGDGALFERNVYCISSLIRSKMNR